jgi:hypothetical protein
MEETKDSQEVDVQKLQNDVAALKSMNSQLISELQRMNMTNVFKRLEYLFKVIEFGKSFNQEFTKKCAAEIEYHMTIPAEDDTEEEATENKED